MHPGMTKIAAASEAHLSKPIGRMDLSAGESEICLIVLAPNRTIARTDLALI
jgi:hypothetical protein